jgi:hypothetical protein
MDALVWAFTELLVGPVISGPMSLIA